MDSILPELLVGYSSEGLAAFDYGDVGLGGLETKVEVTLVISGVKEEPCCGEEAVDTHSFDESDDASLGGGGFFPKHLILVWVMGL